MFTIICNYADEEDEYLWVKFMQFLKPNASDSQQYYFLYYMWIITEAANAVQNLFFPKLLLGKFLNLFQEACSNQVLQCL